MNEWISDTLLITYLLRDNNDGEHNRTILRLLGEDDDSRH